MSWPILSTKYLNSILMLFYLFPLNYLTSVRHVAVPYAARRLLLNAGRAYLFLTTAEKSEYFTFSLTPHSSRTNYLASQCAICFYVYVTQASRVFRGRHEFVTGSIWTKWMKSRTKLSMVFVSP